MCFTFLAFHKFIDQSTLWPQAAIKAGKHCHFIKCYREGKPAPYDGIRLPDVLESDRKPRLGKTTFIHETSCSINGLVMLKPRQICSIESAAKNNPNFDIFVMFSSPRYISLNTLSPEIWRLKITYQNIFFRNSNMWKFAEGCPHAVEFLERGRLFESYELPVDMSNFVRLLRLWRYGGIYMDTDIIVMKSLEKFTSNFAGIGEDDGTGTSLNNALMSLEPHGFGHGMAEQFVEDYVSNFDPVGWLENGPYSITRTLKKACDSAVLMNLTVGKCEEFNIFPREMFHAVDYTSAEYVFEPKHFNNLKVQIKESYAIHVFDTVTQSMKCKKWFFI